MSVGGVSGGGGPFRPEESSEPSGVSKSFQMPNWKSPLNEALEHIDPNDPKDVDRAVDLLTSLSSDPSTPQNIQVVAKQAADQIQSGYLVSKNPMELMQPYLSLSTITQPIGPGRA